MTENEATTLEQLARDPGCSAELRPILFSLVGMHHSGMPLTPVTDLCLELSLKGLELLKGRKSANGRN